MEGDGDKTMNAIENLFPLKLTSAQLESFWSKVNKTDSCWLWTGATRLFRYGSFRINGRPKAGRVIQLEMTQE